MCCDIGDFPVEINPGPQVQTDEQIAGMFVCGYTGYNYCFNSLLAWIEHALNSTFRKSFEERRPVHC